MSPRIRLNYYPSTSTTAYVYYGRLFIPDEHRGSCARLRAPRMPDRIAQPTLPERDHFFEVGLVQRIPDRLASIAKLARPTTRRAPRASTTTRFPARRSSPTSTSSTFTSRASRASSRFDPTRCSQATSMPRSTTRTATGTITGGFFPSEPPSASSISTTISDCRSSAASRTRRVVSILSGTAIYRIGPDQRRRPERLRLHASGRVCSTSTRASTCRRARSSTEPRGYHRCVAGRNGASAGDLRRQSRSNKKYLLKGAFFATRPWRSRMTGCWRPVEQAAAAAQSVPCLTLKLEHCLLTQITLSGRDSSAAPRLPARLAGATCPRSATASR